MSVDQHFLQVQHVLLQTVRHLLNLDKLVAVVLVEHALHTHCHTALLAKILDGFVGVTGTKDVGLASFDCVGKEKHLWGEHILTSL